MLFILQPQLMKFLISELIIREDPWWIMAFIVLVAQLPPSYIQQFDPLKFNTTGYNLVNFYLLSQEICL